jgi:hypothetical protein
LFVCIPNLHHSIVEADENVSFTNYHAQTFHKPIIPTNLVKKSEKKRRRMTLTKVLCITVAKMANQKAQRAMVGSRKWNGPHGFPLASQGVSRHYS